MTDKNLIRQRLRVRGVVQGVGFRPFVYSLAHRHALTGFVGNDSHGVFIEVEGDAAGVARFTTDLQRDPPPLAHIESIDSRNLPAQGASAFIIVESAVQVGAHTLISPDLCTCDACFAELNDPDNRRYRYPFINCTHCGPRFTITRDIPYDRPLTTMASFPMCAACEAEYNDPLDRRFHAQPNACPNCGPQVTFVDGTRQLRGDAGLWAAFDALHNGAIVAIKGLGGFHLACDATHNTVVDQLRERKGRPDKPLAIMVRDLAMARSVAHVDDAEAAHLLQRERPIVLLKRRDDSGLASAIAPGNATVGVMLPYTPLHALLLDERPLVMTSGNLSTQPINIYNDDALAKLGHIADAFLLHDRDIHVPCDDSVVRVYAGQELPVRRSRGYAPFPVRLPHETPPLLAVGGELKSTLCLTRGQYAFLSQHIGDMENLETLHTFEAAYEHLRALFRIEPQAIVCDMHPRYLSSQWAGRHAAETGLPLLKVQHHHAHIAAVMAENNRIDPVIGFSFDGTGYGDDGAIWGGEVMIADLRAYERADHLGYLPLAGGDAAVKNPYRLALAYLWASGITWDDVLAPVQHSSETERRILRQQLERNLNVVQTSSMGRLFDAVAALIGVRQRVTYEAQAAIEMETMTFDTPETYPFTLNDPRSLLYALCEDVRRGQSQAVMAAKFHNTVASAIVETSIGLRQQTGIRHVALSGGVFQNVALLQRTVQSLNQHDFEVYVHHQVPPNDGGLALGQAMIASQHLN